MISGRALRGFLSLCGGLVLAPALAAPVLARNEVRVEVDLLVPPLQRLEILRPILVMAPLTARDLTSEFIDLPQRIEIHVSSNTPWELSVRMAELSSARAEEGPPLLCAPAGEAPRILDHDWQFVAKGDAGEEIEVALGLRVPLEPSGLAPGTHEVTLDYRLTSAGN